MGYLWSTIKQYEICLKRSIKACWTSAELIARVYIWLTMVSSRQLIILHERTTISISFFRVTPCQLVECSAYIVGVVYTPRGTRKWLFNCLSVCLSVCLSDIETRHNHKRIEITTNDEVKTNAKYQDHINLVLMQKL